MKVYKIILIYILLITNLFALVFDRRDNTTSYNSYYIYPLALSMPGIGDAVGASVMGNNLLKSDMDIIALHMEGDFNLNVLTAIDMPLHSTKLYDLTVSSSYLNFTNGTVEGYERGRDSNKDDKYYFDTNELEAKGVELSLGYFDKQLEFYGGYSYIYSDPKSIRDTNGNELADNIDDIKANIYRVGIYLDDTDNRRDPRVGYRIQYERMGVLHNEKKFGDGYQEDINLSAFIPIFNINNILVVNYFHSSATITREGRVDPLDYQCDPNDTTCDQSIYDDLMHRREEAVQKGNATSLGGTQRLRAYPQGRFYDAHTAFIGFEYRWYFKDYWKPFNKYLWKGVNTGLQLALFQEFGQVGEYDNSTLYEDMKSSTGIGLRILFNTMVVRIDVATGDEGEQFTFYYGYSF